MGCICSNETSSKDVDYYSNDAKTDPNNLSTQFDVPPSREMVMYKVNGGFEFVRAPSYSSRGQSRLHSGPLVLSRKPSDHKNRHQLHRRATMDMGDGPIVSMPRSRQGEQAAAGWPFWLTAVAAEAIHGWVPRRADSFQQLDKIGQGTYSTVYKARDLETGKIVAMKNVRFINVDPDSVRFMAREILVLRRLDHPNAMKLEGLVASKVSSSLQLVFEYMEHDLAGLSGKPANKFTEPQIKCYMQQLLLGLEHCHSRGVLHRDIKGSNLLINNDGVLKIGDFGLANFFKPDQEEPLTSRVVTLWYRAPELLLGSTNYGVAVDMWSVGCILAELFAGKPIMPGGTEVEQMHKIFKLCGSPSDDYWKNLKSLQATSFKPTQPYKRLVNETFSYLPSSALALVEMLLAIEPEKRGNASSALKSEFFTTNPLPCDPSDLPKHPPTKEQDIKFGEEEKRRKKTEEVKSQLPETIRTGIREPKPGFGGAGGRATMNIYNAVENGSGGLTVNTQRRGLESHHSTKGVHPSTTAESWKAKEDGIQQNGHAYSSSQKKAAELMVHLGNEDSTALIHLCSYLYLGNGKKKVHEQKKNKMHYSGPLMPPGGNMDDMLREHERYIQEAVRKSKARTTNHGQ